MIGRSESVAKNKKSSMVPSRHILEICLFSMLRSEFYKDLFPAPQADHTTSDLISQRSKALKNTMLPMHLQPIDQRGAVTVRNPFTTNPYMSSFVQTLTLKTNIFQQCNKHREDRGGGYFTKSRNFTHTLHCSHRSLV